MRRATERESLPHEDVTTAAPVRSPVPAPPRPSSRLGRWLREPLLHFLLAGILLFAAYRALNPEEGARLASNRIVITDDDLRQMSLAWTAQGRPPATGDQWATLIEARVREEIMFREALALGLDKNDAIVRRRMAQKMELVVQELAKVADPTPAELRAWFDANPERFAQPARASFRLLYFSPERRGSRARADAESAKEKLATATRDAAVASELSDPFVAPDRHIDRTPEQIARELGADFGRSLFALKPTAEWQGPIESGHGWHLVWLDSLQARRIPAFEEVEQEVKATWIDQQNADARRKAYAAMRARYDVIVPERPKTAPAPDK